MNKTIIRPICSYLNPEIQKKDIYKNNKNKSGIYLWTNLVSGKSYVGSSVDIPKRMSNYFSISRIEKMLLKTNSHIYKAILEYGYSKFKLDILEYCDRDNLLIREQFYLDNLELEYNTLRVAGSFTGFKHSDSSKELIRKSRLGKSCSEITKLKLSANPQAFSLIVKSKNSDEVYVFPSIRRTACFLNMHHSYIGRCLKKKYFYENKFYYVIKSST